MNEMITPSPMLHPQTLGAQSLGLSYEVIIVHPRSLRDMPEIVQALRTRKAVILNLEALDERLAQRVSDFAAGSAHAIAGHQRQLGKGVFLYTPDSIKIVRRPQALPPRQEETEPTVGLSEAS